VSIEAIGTGIKTTILATIATGLRVYASNEIPDSLELPCVLVVLGPGDYATTFDGSYDQVFRLILCVSKQDSPSAFNKLLDYIDHTGAKSIFAALDTDRTLNATCSASKCASHTGAGSTLWGNIVYLSTEFQLQVWS